MPTLEIDEDKALALVTGQYGQASLRQIASFAVPFFIVDRGTISPRNLDAAQRLIANGTAFVMNIGKGPFAVTANHVIERALATDVTNRGLFPTRYQPPARPLLQLNDLEDRIIARNVEKDIATFRLTEMEVDALDISVLTSHPNTPLERRGGVAFVGFPGIQRDLVEVREDNDGAVLVLCWGVFPGFGVAASVSERQISFEFDRGNLASPPPGFSAPALDMDLGGMSGGPMLMKCETPSGLEYWAPAGVITQGKMQPNWNSGFLFASRLDGLTQNGQL
jgi:hypothetical protein